MAKTITDTDIVRRKNLDFEVYKQSDPQSLVDWGKAARDISKTFNDIREERQKKRTEIDTAYRDQQAELNDIGQYESRNIQQFVMNGANSIAEKSANFYDLVKRGQARPADYALFRQNVSNGFKQVKENALSIDKDYKEFAERSLVNAKGFTTNAEKERWIATQLESFANLQNATLDANEITGELSFLKLDENGKVIPGKSRSINQIGGLLKQRINNVDLDAEVGRAVKSLGTVIRTEMRKAGYDMTLTEVEMKRAENQFIQNQGGRAYIRKLAEAMTVGEKATTILSSYVLTNTGDNYRSGTQEDYDEWERENKGKTRYEAAEITNTAEGNKFREWVRNKYGATEIKDEFDLDAKGSIDFEGFIEAYEKYGEEYSREMGIGTEITEKVENPIIVQEYDPKSNSYISKPTKDQTNKVVDFVMEKINMGMGYKESVDVKRGTVPPRLQEWQWRMHQEEKQFRTYAELTDAFNLAKRNATKPLSANEKVILKDALTSLAEQSKNADDIEFDFTTNEFIIKKDGKDSRRVSITGSDSKKNLAPYVYGTTGGKQELQVYELEEKRYNKAKKSSKKKNKNVNVG